jgi:hypothetical protein
MQWWAALCGTALVRLTRRCQIRSVTTTCFRAPAAATIVAGAETRMMRGTHFDRSVTPLCLRWYLAYNHSLPNLEEVMTERSIPVDYAASRYTVRNSPELLERFSRCK